MKLRSISANELIKSLSKIGYEITRQKGSHIRLTARYPKVHHVTVPNHNPIRIGTLSAILTDVATARNQNKEELIQDIFG